MGFNLINLVISTGLSTVVMITCITTYVFLKGQSLTISKNLDLSQNLNMINYYLRKDIERAGFLKNLKSLNIEVNDKCFMVDGDLNSNSNIISKYHQSILNQKYGSDALTLLNVQHNEFKLLKDLKNTNSPIALLGNEMPYMKTKMVIYDKNKSDVFMVSDIKNNLIYHQLPFNKSNALSHGYLLDSKIIELRDITYALKESIKGDGSYALYRIFHNNNEQSEAILEKVYDMKVEYGILNKNEIIYSKGEGLLNYDNVKTIRVKLKLLEERDKKVKKLSLGKYFIFDIKLKYA